jgi:hypothetical protein
MGMASNLQGTSVVRPSKTLDFLLGPGDCLIDCFAALGAAGDQLRHRALRIHLVGHLSRMPWCGDTLLGVSCRADQDTPNRLASPGGSLV